MHPPAGEEEVFGDLATRLATAHHQHAPLRELLWVAVLQGIQLEHGGRQPGGQGGTAGPVIGTGGHHHLGGPQLTGAGEST
jgi:hypothetical protein